MPLPSTLPELAIEGYLHSGTGKCAACRAPLDWFTTPNGRRMPFSKKQALMVGESTLFTLTSETQYEPHWASCPSAHRFRRKR